MEKDRLLCTYAALILHDGQLEISEEKLNKVIRATDNSVESYMPGLFAEALKSQDINKLLKNAADAVAPSPEEPVNDAYSEFPETDEEIGDDEGYGLFGPSDDDY